MSKSRREVLATSAALLAASAQGAVGRLFHEGTIGRVGLALGVQAERPPAFA